jgi:hypothetical protein
MRASLLTLAALAVATPALAEDLPIRPDPTLTPGVVASTDEAEVCGVVDGKTYSQRHRQTTAAMKAEVFKRYGIEKDGREFEIDHRLELSLGGADDVRNLWPQEGMTHPSFHDKDRLESRVWRMVCKKHSMSLADAQAIFLGDWIAGYQKMFSEPPE